MNHQELALWRLCNIEIAPEGKGFVARSLTDIAAGNFDNVLDYAASRADLVRTTYNAFFRRNPQ